MAKRNKSQWPSLPHSLECVMVCVVCLEPKADGWVPVWSLQHKHLKILCQPTTEASPLHALFNKPMGRNLRLVGS
jgi:hypothetical protein